MRRTVRRNGLNLAIVACLAILSVRCARAPDELATTADDADDADAGAKLTVFAEDPEYGVYGMYREGADYVFYRIKASAGEDGAVRAGTEFFDRDMDPIAVKEGPVTALAAARGAAATSGARAALVAAAAAALEARLGHEAFAAERVALAPFRAGREDSSIRQQAPGEVAAALTPAARAQAAAAYYQALRKNLAWQKGAGAELSGRYAGTTFHAAHQVVFGEGEYGAVTARVERNARITSATGANIAVQLGGHEVPEGYTVGPDQRAPQLFGKKGRTAVQDLENHHQGLGEGFMAARVISREGGLAEEEREIFARMGAHLAERLLPLSRAERAAAPNVDGESLASAAAATTYRSWIRRSWMWITKDAFGVTLPAPVHHSATLTNFFLNGSYRGGTWYCNHGCCDMQTTGGCSMGSPCTAESTSSSRWGIPPYEKDNGHTAPGGLPSYHTCRTPYKWYGPKNTHVCNDDTLTQIRAVKLQGFCIGPNGTNCYNSPPYSVECSDMRPAPWAPGCK